ncbi:MAG: signal peptidase I [Sharpea porci]|uniref:signal peptidase I n=1 Tax=Sharpea porci TaxID=2652286 RepID=UPI00240A8B01|nr:signal peptidase I [Sharpea porci]MDD6711854.1 signal peptidase I [Sharpea porci]
MKTDSVLHPLADIHSQIYEKRQQLGLKRGYLDLFKNVGIMLLIILIAFTQIFYITVSKGTDMYPAILDGDIVFGYRLDTTYLKNDVVVCNVNNKKVISRVVAKEGDSVEITKDGKLFVNGTEQTGEIAFPTKRGKQHYPYIVPKGCVYLLGDYRTHTTDSRNFGPVKKENIKAKVISIFRRRGI